ncbi:MAG TPA: cytochrome c3 family protein [Thermoguttaceae bacterium]|nr:cytochrome c3 family protein [Thermoguttaceae bacterium]
MDRQNRLRLVLSTGLVLAGLVLGYAVAHCADEPAKPADDGVLFPPDHAVLLSGTFDVICKTDEAVLEVDGKPREWEPFEPPLRVAHLGLSPGMHELRIGDRRREIVVALNEEEHDGPEDWPILRRHQMNRDPGRCGDCHQTTKQDDRVVVGELKSYEACIECHDAVDFEATHSHPLEPIEHCRMCHALHGSARKGLLKAPVKQLCAECHDA